MDSITFCILDNDAHYIKAFMNAVAADYSGCAIKVRNTCGSDCGLDVDACIRFGPLINEGQRSCDKAFQPACGRYAGVSAIMREIKIFVSGKISEQNNSMTAMQSPANVPVQVLPFTPGTLICVYSPAGGTGTSVSAIGIGRELSRYRGEQVFYLSLEDLEDKSLYPQGLSAMRSGEVLYRYFRTTYADAMQADAYTSLFRSAVMRDEYGLFRIAPDESLNAIAELTQDELYIFLSRITVSLGLTRIVLDFGTRMHFLLTFAEQTDENETIFIKISSATKDYDPKIKGGPVFTASFTRCDGDIKTSGAEIEIGLANTFGQEVKELCGLIGGCLQ